MDTMSSLTIFLRSGDHDFSERLTYRPSNSDLLLRSCNGGSLRTVESILLRFRRKDLTVSAKLKRFPTDNESNAESEDILHNVRLKPVDLEHEKLLIALNRQIGEVRRIAAQTGLDFNHQISSLESNYEQALRKLYVNLTPTCQMNLAQHPVEFVELHGNKETLKVEQFEELGVLVHSESDLNEKMIQKLKREIGHEYSEAAETLGLKDKLVILHQEFAVTSNSADQILHDPILQDRIKRLNDEFNRNLPQAPNYAKLKFMLDMLTEISEARDLSDSLKLKEMLIP